jgi:hypothetical protein
MQKRFLTSLSHKGPFKANVKFWSTVLQRFPAGSKNCVELSWENAADIHAELRLGFMHKSKLESEAVDVITASLLIPDDVGRVWSLDSTFTPEAFITHMFDCSAFRQMGLQSASRISKKVKVAFQRDLLLRGARIFCDDRFYRVLLLDNKLFEVQFKYTQITFDAALHVDTKGLSPDLVIRIRRKSLWGNPYKPDTGKKAPQSDEEEEFEFEDLGECYFFMQWEQLFKHNCAVYDEAEGRWTMSLFPYPLEFHPTPLKAKAQKPVKLVQCAE